MAPRPTPNIASDNDDRGHTRNKNTVACISYAPCGIETNPDPRADKSALVAGASARDTVPVQPDSGERNQSNIDEPKHRSKRERRPTTFRKRRLQSKQHLSLEHFFVDKHQEFLFRFGASYRDFVVPPQTHQASEEELE